MDDQCESKQSRSNLHSCHNPECLLDDHDILSTISRVSNQGILNGRDLKRLKRTGLNFYRLKIIEILFWLVSY
jgi:hypothetical protein